MPSIYISPLGRLGNNIIQYMAGRLLARAFGHTLVRFKSECADAFVLTDTSEGSYSFSWQWFCEFVYEFGCSGTLRDHPLASRNLHLSGYFQQSDIYVENRDWLRDLFVPENRDWLNLSTRVCDLMRAEGRASENPVVHFRLGDYQVSPTKSFILKPRVFLRPLRELSAEAVSLVAAPPQTDEEKMYLALFADVGGVHTCGTELEDHATLRNANILFCSNSTFAWTAAFLGSAERLWMAPIRGFSAEQNLKPLPDAQPLAEEFTLLQDLSTGEAYPTPFAGEDLEALCDCIVLTKEKEEYHGGLERLVPRSNWVFLEDPQSYWTLVGAQIVFIYADLFDSALPRILDCMESVRLLVLHNADTEPSAEGMLRFLERYPAAHIYAQNNVVRHPRIHSLPMGVQNRMWRQGTLEASAPSLEKAYLALASYFSPTHPVRAELTEFLRATPFEGLYMPRHCSQGEYFANLFSSAFSFCPPGNAHDTHRLWESLYCGAFPIVQADAFIARLLESMPLPLLVVDRFVEEDDYGAKLDAFLRQKKYRFEAPRCLFLKYWSLLFETYRAPT